MSSGAYLLSQTTLLKRHNLTTTHMLDQALQLLEAHDDVTAAKFSLFLCEARDSLASALRMLEQETKKGFALLI